MHFGPMLASLVIIPNKDMSSENLTCRILLSLHRQSEMLSINSEGDRTDFVMHEYSSGFYWTGPLGWSVKSSHAVVSWFKEKKKTH